MLIFYCVAFSQAKKHAMHLAKINDLLYINGYVFLTYLWNNVLLEVLLEVL